MKNRSAFRFVLITFAALPSCLSQTRSARFFNGSVRETQRAKSRRTPPEDFALAKIDRDTDAARTPGGEASSCGRATRNQEISTAPFEAAIAHRTGRGRMRTPDQQPDSQKDSEKRMKTRNV